MKTRLRRWLETHAVCTYIGLARNDLMPIIPNVFPYTMYKNADVTEEEMEKLKEADRLLEEVWESISERGREELEYMDKKVEENGN